MKERIVAEAKRCTTFNLGFKPRNTIPYISVWFGNTWSNAMGRARNLVTDHFIFGRSLASSYPTTCSLIHTPSIHCILNLPPAISLSLACRRLLHWCVISIEICSAKEYFVESRNSSAKLLPQQVLLRICAVLYCAKRVLEITSELRLNETRLLPPWAVLMFLYQGFGLEGPSTLGIGLLLSFPRAM